jgi:hypothetical protein
MRRRSYQVTEERRNPAAGRESEEEVGSSRTTGTTKVWGVRVRSGRGARRVMLGRGFRGAA